MPATPISVLKMVELVDYAESKFRSGRYGSVHCFSDDLLEILKIAERPIPDGEKLVVLHSVNQGNSSLQQRKKSRIRLLSVRPVPLCCVLVMDSKRASFRFHTQRSAFIGLSEKRAFPIEHGLGLAIQYSQHFGATKIAKIRVIGTCVLRSFWKRAIGKWQ